MDAHKSGGGGGGKTNISFLLSEGHGWSRRPKKTDNGKMRKKKKERREERQEGCSYLKLIGKIRGRRREAGFLWRGGREK